MLVRRTDHRRGFTLVELLVVIAIIGVLVGLLLPAVQAAREAARRMSCGNNLKQLGLACHNYESTFKTLPFNSVVGNAEDHPNNAPRNPERINRWMQFSWLTHVLPFVEQQPLYDQIEFNSFGMRTPFNQPFAATPIATYMCPSSAHEPIANGQTEGYRWEGGNITAARTDYVGSMGHIWGGWKDCAAVPDFVEANPPGANLFTRGANPGTPWVNGEFLNEQVNVNGLFLYYGSVKMSQATDGLSNTIMVFENQHYRGGNNPAQFDRRISQHAAWMSPNAAVHNLRNPINNRNPAWMQGAGDLRCESPSSEHPGGIQVALGDGSVRFLSESLDHLTRYSLGVRNDALPVRMPD